MNTNSAPCSFPVTADSRSCNGSESKQALQSDTGRAMDGVLTDEQQSRTSPVDMLSENKKVSVMFKLKSSKVTNSGLRFHGDFGNVEGPISHITIVTDSQSCINRIGQRHQKGRDDALTGSYIRTDTAIQRLQKLKLSDDFVSLQWVHSHNDCMFNDAADGLAKAAALIVRYLTDPMRRSGRAIFAVNAFIGLQTIKREAKALVTQRAGVRWRDHCEGKRTSITKCHFWKWKLPKKRGYEKELPYLNLKEQRIRLMLYMGSLPLNYWRQYSGCKTAISGGTDCCEQMGCEGKYHPETMHHFIAVCPEYEVQRDELKDILERVQRAHNRMSDEFDDVEPVTIIEDWNDEHILKSLIFPSKKLAMTERITILKAVIEFVERTGRFENGE